MVDSSFLYKGLRITFLFLMISLISYLIFFLNAGIKKRVISNPKETSPITKEADTGIDDFSFFQTKDGRVEWEIKAKRAELFEAENMMMLKDIKAKISRADGMVVYLAGDEGNLNTVNKDFQINKVDKEIKVNLEDNLTIATSSLRWVNEKREIISDTPVDIRWAGLAIKGNYFIVNVDSQQFEVSGGVETYFDR